MNITKRMITLWIVAIMATLLVAGCASRTPRNEDGAIVGTVTRVRRDSMNLDVEGGGNVRIDTWGVCGDSTADNISVGDTVTVFASKDLFSYDAWRILDENGDRACSLTSRR